MIQKRVYLYIHANLVVVEQLVYIRPHGCGILQRPTEFRVVPFIFRYDLCNTSVWTHKKVKGGLTKYVTEGGKIRTT